MGKLSLAAGESDRDWKSWAGGLFLLAVVSLGGVGLVGRVRAYMTKSQVLGESEIVAATIDLSTSPSSALFSYQDIAPGFTSGEKFVIVENSGTVDLKYRLTAQYQDVADNNDLYQSLEVTVKVYDGAGAFKETAYDDEALKDLLDLEIGEVVLAGETRKLGLILSLPFGVGNEVEGQTTHFEFVFDSIQSDGSW